MDLVKLETARQVFASVFQTVEGEAFVKQPDFRASVVDACVDAANKICSGIGEAKGHPAETALEQLFDLLDDHPDDKAFKWIKANAKLRGLKELCTYLGAERVAEPVAH